MQVQSINNTHCTNFGAKLNLYGTLKDIDMTHRQAWINKAKNIGAESDIITIELGEHKLTSQNIMTARRDIFARANIDGENVLLDEYEKTKSKGSNNIGYFRQDTFDSELLTNHAIHRYLDKLYEHLNPNKALMAKLNDTMEDFDEKRLSFMIQVAELIKETFGESK